VKQWNSKKLDKSPKILPPPPNILESELVRNTFPKFDEEPISPSALKKYPFNE
jgi:hypothetical protein